VYAFGNGAYGKLGNADTADVNVPTKISELRDIKQIAIYQDISLALNNNGEVFVFGYGYSSIAMKLIFKEKVVSISGTLLLTEKGEVYDISDLTKPMDDFKDISKISCGEEHWGYLTSDGYVYLMRK